MSIAPDPSEQQPQLTPPQHYPIAPLDPQVIGALIDSMVQQYGQLSLHHEYLLGPAERWLCQYPPSFPVVELNTWACDPRCSACVSRLVEAHRHPFLPLVGLRAGMVDIPPHQLVEVVQGARRRLLAAIG